MAKVDTKKVSTKKEDTIIIDDLKGKLKNTPKSNSKTDKETKDVVIEKVEAPTKAPVKMVKILVAKNHKCFIGGEWYYLLADKQYNVPQNVKEILAKANILKPL